MTEATSKPLRKPLSQQVVECQFSWFKEAIEYAQDGDPVQMGLVGLMLQTGWGCDKDPAEAQKWLAEASRHGAEMSPGYKEPPIEKVPPPAALAKLPRPGTAPGFTPSQPTGTPSSESEQDWVGSHQPPAARSRPQSSPAAPTQQAPAVQPAQAQPMQQQGHEPNTLHQERGSKATLAPQPEQEKAAASVNSSQQSAVSAASHHSSTSTPPLGAAREQSGNNLDTKRSIEHIPASLVKDINQLSLNV